jgi:hypothetical protein
MLRESDYKHTDNKNCGIRNLEKHVRSCGSLKILTGLPGMRSGHVY